MNLSSYMSSPPRNPALERLNLKCSRFWQGRLPEASAARAGNAPHPKASNDFPPVADMRREQLVRLFAVGEPAGRRIPLQLARDLLRDAPQQHGLCQRHRVVDVRERLGAAADIGYGVVATRSRCAACIS